MLEFLHAIHWIHWHHHGIQTQNSKMRDDQLGAVLHVQHHPVALLNPHFLECRGNVLC